MGKGGSAKSKGKGKAAVGSSGPAATSDDALLDAAIAENATLKAAAAAQAEETKAKEAAKAAIRIAQAKFKAGTSPKGELLTMPETLGKLDRVMVFTLVRLLADGSKDSAPLDDGFIVFFVDAADAQAALVELQKAHPDFKLGIDHAPLGRAFALSQGLMGLKMPAPSRIQFAKGVVAAEGDKGVPKELREKMASAGPFPLFYSDKIGNPSFTPVFFSRDDLSDFWHEHGGPSEVSPEDHTTVTDLRILVARTLQEPGSWQPLHYVPPKASANLSKQLMERIDVDKKVSEGFMAGVQRMKAEEHKLAVQRGDEPPALS